jgi:hypothetical protein
VHLNETISVRGTVAVKPNKLVHVLAVFDRDYAQVVDVALAGRGVLNGSISLSEFRLTVGLHSLTFCDAGDDGKFGRHSVSFHLTVGQLEATIEPASRGGCAVIRVEVKPNHD